MTRNNKLTAHSWLALMIAAMAMVATLPGRTHGLGLITEPLLHDLKIDRVDYGLMNLWATLIGATFCLPCGWLMDRLGSRLLLLSVCSFLGIVVLTMSWLPPNAPWVLFTLILLTRGLGQSTSLS